MSVGKLKFGKVNRYIPFILILGVGLGIVDYTMGSKQNIFQLILIHLVTTFIIAYLMLLVVYNQDMLVIFGKSRWQKYILFILIFMIIGVFASEVEVLLRAKILHSEDYHPFSGGNLYLSNAIITALIGIGTVISSKVLEAQKSKDVEVQEEVVEENQKLTTIPTKHGENIHLLPIQDILYFESYDNYSFVITKDGSRRLCDFNLKFLETRLDERFLRIHRKYIVNKQQIEAIKPHLNSRYVLELYGKDNPSIMSSKTYVGAIKSLIKLT